MKKILFGVLLLLTLFSKAQRPADTIRFADFHIHTSFKHYYKDIKSVDDIYDHFNDIAYLQKTFGTVNWKEYVHNRKKMTTGAVSTVHNYNQSDFFSLTSTPGSVLCTSLYPYEKQFALSRLKQLISNLVVSRIPLRRLKEIGSENSYPMKEFLSEYRFLTVQDHKDPNSNFVTRLAADKQDLLDILSDKNASAQILSIEGGQVLYGPYAGNRKRVKNAAADSTARSEILENVDLLRNLPHKVFFLTPSHFTDNMIAGFAKTIDRPGMTRELLRTLSKSGIFRGAFFTKNGEGKHGDLDIGKYDTCDCQDISFYGVSMPYTFNSKKYKKTAPELRKGIGNEVIEKLLKPDSGYSKRILIDVKHFDIQARFEYYALVKELEKRYDKRIPIIAGHVAMSGEKLPVAMATGLNPLFDRYEEIKNPLKFYSEQVDNSDIAGNWLCRTGNLRKEDHDKFFIDPTNSPNRFNPFEGNIDTNTVGWFYPWSINLCDEEVPIIYESDGIIGLNFDERILGGYMLNYSKKYRDSLKNVFLQFANYHYQTEPNFTPCFDDYYKCEPFLRNILYIVTKSNRNDTTAWYHIAIGSDFDGLIDPVDLCPTALQIPSYHNKLITFLELFWQIHKNDPMFEGKDLFFSNSITYAEAVRRVFYQNGYDFIMKYY